MINILDTEYVPQALRWATDYYDDRGTKSLTKWVKIHNEIVLDIVKNEDYSNLTFFEKISFIDGSEMIWSPGWKIKI